MRLDELAPLARELARIADEAGAVRITKAGEIIGTYDPQAEELACMMVSKAVREGAFGFADRRELIETLENIITAAHRQLR